MENKLETYQTILTNLLNDYARLWNNSKDGIETQVVIDKNNRHFQMVNIGWQKHRFIYSVPFHFEIKGGKVWIHVNNTEIQIGEELAKLGIPKSDIVLGFQPEHRRPFTGYAVA